MISVYPKVLVIIHTSPKYWISAALKLSELIHSLSMRDIHAIVYHVISVGSLTCSKLKTANAAVLWEYAVDLKWTVEKWCIAGEEAYRFSN